MGQIQNAINSVISSTGAAVAVAKGIGKMESDKKEAAASKTLNKAKIQMQLAETGSKIQKTTEEVNQNKELLKTAQEGFDVINVGGKDVKLPIDRLYPGDIAKKEQNKLIEKYQNSLKEKEDILAAMNLQRAGLKELFDFYKGEKR